MSYTTMQACTQIAALALLSVPGSARLAGQSHPPREAMHSKSVSTSFPKTLAPVDPRTAISVEILGPGKKGVICVNPSADAADHVQVQAVLADFSPQTALVDGLRLEKMIPLDASKIRISGNEIRVEPGAAVHQRAMIYILIPTTAAYSIQMDAKVIAQQEPGAPVMIAAGEIVENPSGYDLRTEMFELLGFHLRVSGQ